MSEVDRVIRQEKEKPSRLARRRQREARSRRRLLAVVAAAVAIVLAVGAAWNIPYINAARAAASWVRDRLRGAGSGGGTGEPPYLFLTHPGTGKVLSGEVSVLWVVYKEDNSASRAVLGLCLAIYRWEEGTLSLFFVPENAVAYNARGEATRLSAALREEGGEDMLRSTVQNMTGAKVDYMVLCSFRGAVDILQEMDLPPLTLREDTLLADPYGGGTQLLFAGQKVRDADRLLSYLLALERSGEWEGYYARRERAEEYLPALLVELSQRKGGYLVEERFMSSNALRLSPAASSPQKDALYLASMLQAAVDMGREHMPCRAVPRVEVLNGCGVPELGRKVGERLSSLGVPLAGTGGNAKMMVEGVEVNDFSYDKSVVVCRSADERVRAYARYLGVLLSIDEVRLEGGPGPELVIVAGRDMAQ